MDIGAGYDVVFNVRNGEMVSWLLLECCRIVQQRLTHRLKELRQLGLHRSGMQHHQSRTCELVNLYLSSLKIGKYLFM